MEKFSSIFPTLEIMNEYKNDMAEDIPDINKQEWVALNGRYNESEIRYGNRYQFMCNFFTILRESQEKLRKKLSINTTLRSLTDEESLVSDEIITNNAVNPDTEPSTDNYTPLPYVNTQSAQISKQGKVRGLYALKHSIGGQAYNEFLDSFRPLFRVILVEKEVVYG